MVVPFLNIPIISVVMMLLAGILIGNLIWYRDRSEDEAMLVGLRHEHNELESALHEHKQAYLELQADHDDRRQESDQLKAALMQIEQSRHEAEQEKQELNGELARLMQLKDQAFHDLDQERQHRRGLQEALSRAESTNEQNEQATEQLRSHVSSFQQECESLKATAQAVTQERMQLESDLRQAVAELHQQVQTLTAERSRADAELASRSAELEATQSDLQRAQEDLHARQTALDALRLDRNDLSKQVDDEREAREQLARQANQVSELVGQRDRALERAGLAEAKTVQLEEQIAAVRGELETGRQAHQQSLSEFETSRSELQQQLDSLNREHEAVTTMLVDERSRLSKMEADNHHLSLVAAEQSETAERKLADLRSQVEMRVGELQTLRGELEETAAQLSRERHQREHLQEVLDRRSVESSELRRRQEQDREQLEVFLKQKEALGAQVEELDALRGEHASAKQIISQLTSRLDAARSTHEALTSRNQNLQQQCGELETQVDEMTKRVAQVASVREEYGVQLSDLQRVHEEVIEQRVELSQQVEILRDEVDHLRSSEVDRARGQRQRETELRELQDLHQEQQVRLSQVLTQRDEAMASHAAAEEGLVDLRGQLESQSRALSALHQQAAHWQSQQRQYDALREEHLELSTSANSAADELEDLMAEREQAVTELASLKKRVAMHEQTIRRLRRERQEVMSRPQQVVASIPMVSHPAADRDGRLRRDELLGLVYTQPPERKDDLKRITGIAQVLEKKLNAFGVYTYHQIMEWDEVAIAEFSKLLSFRDRIVRDDWVGQAKNLQYEIYGRAA